MEKEKEKWVLVFREPMGTGERYITEDRKAKPRRAFNEPEL